MALSKCPECGAAVTARGGATTTCPKCNTVFDAGMAGGIDEPDAGGQNWSYKNSWQRYAVLTVMLAVMAVLGYLLYEKRTGRAENAAAGGGDEELKMTTFKIADGDAQKDVRLKPLANPGSPAGPVGGQRTDGDATKRGRGVAELQKDLVGTWESKTGDETATVEYKDDGTFTYTATGGAKAVSGRWKLVPPEARAGSPMLEWTVEGQTIPPAPVSPRGGKLEKHPLLHRPADSGTFERK